MITVASDGTEQVYYFVNNLQGTPTMIMDATGNVVQRIQMDAYGNVEQMVGIFGDEINYTGKKLNPITGLFGYALPWNNCIHSARMQTDKLL